MDGSPNVLERLHRAVDVRAQCQSRFLSLWVPLKFSYLQILRSLNASAAMQVQWLE